MLWLREDFETIFVQIGLLHFKVCYLFERGFALLHLDFFSAVVSNPCLRSCHTKTLHPSVFTAASLVSTGFNCRHRKLSETVADLWSVKHNLTLQHGVKTRLLAVKPWFYVKIILF